MRPPHDARARGGAGQPRPPARRRRAGRAPAAQGREHERAHLERLRAEGRAIVEIELGEPWDFEAAAARTAQAMRDGAEVIVQATFVDGRWRGRGDFLLKVDRRTKLGDWGYQPLDVRLARQEKLTCVLRLCFYSEGIAAVQGLPPEYMHVLLGVGEQRALRYDDFAAYYRRVRARFEAAIAGRSRVRIAHVEPDHRCPVPQRGVEAACSG